MKGSATIGKSGATSGRAQLCAELDRVAELLGAATGWIELAASDIGTTDTVTQLHMTIVRRAEALLDEARPAVPLVVDEARRLHEEAR